MAKRYLFYKRPIPLFFGGVGLEGLKLYLFVLRRVSIIIIPSLVFSCRSYHAVFKMRQHALLQCFSMMLQNG